MGIMDNVKEAVKLIQQIDNVELYRKILDLQSEVSDLLEENRTLKEEALLERQVSFSRRAYWRNRDGGAVDGPFCTRCWDADRKLIRLLRRHVDWPTCPKCKTWVDENYEK